LSAVNGDGGKLLLLLVWHPVLLGVDCVEGLHEPEMRKPESAGSGPPVSDRLRLAHMPLRIHANGCACATDAHGHSLNPVRG